MNQYFTAAVNHSWIHCKASSLGDWFISKLNGIPRCTWASHLQPQTTGGDTDSRLTGCLLSTTALTKLHHRWRPGPSHQRVTWFNQDQKILRQINRVLLCGSLLILAPLHDTVSVLSAFTWGEVGVPVYSGRPCVVHVGHSNNNKNQWSASGEKKKKSFQVTVWTTTQEEGDEPFASRRGRRRRRERASPALPPPPSPSPSPSPSPHPEQKQQHLRPAEADSLKLVWHHHHHRRHHHHHHHSAAAALNLLPVKPPLHHHHLTLNFSHESKTNKKFNTKKLF